MEDFDNDHDLDLVVSNMDTAQQIRLFINQGDGTFEDHTEVAGLLGITGGLNLIQADYNNDGFVDFFVLRGAWFGDAGCIPNSLVRNNGDGTFTDVTIPAGLANVSYPTQTGGFADFDLDGDLDLFIGNEDLGQRPYRSQLFQNNGDETFTDIGATAGVSENLYTKGSVWGDFDGDRYPDLYVSNLGAPNRLFRNQGDGTFTDVAPELGVSPAVTKLSRLVLGLQQRWPSRLAGGELLAGFAVLCRQPAWPGN